MTDDELRECFRLIVEALKRIEGQLERLMRDQTPPRDPSHPSLALEQDTALDSESTDDE